MIGYAKCKDKEELKNFIKNNKKERKYGLVEDRGGWFYNNYDLLGDFYSEYSIKHNRENRGERLINLFDDDTIYNYVQGFLDGKYSRETFWSLARFKKEDSAE